MKTFKTGTWLWTATLCIALGLVLYLAQGDTGHHQQAHASDEYEPEALLSITSDSLQALEIMIKGKLSRLEKNSTGQWFNHSLLHNRQLHNNQPDNQQPHRVNAAEAARLARGVAMFARIKVDRIIQQGDAMDHSAYGLDFPEVIVLAYADEGAPVLTLHIGDLAADGIGRYVYVPGIQAVAIVPDYQASNLTALIAPATQLSAPAT